MTMMKTNSTSAMLNSACFCRPLAALFSIALVLFCFIMLINSLLNFFLKKGEKP